MIRAEGSAEGSGAASCTRSRTRAGALVLAAVVPCCTGTAGHDAEQLGTADERVIIGDDSRHEYAAVSNSFAIRRLGEASALLLKSTEVLGCDYTQPEWCCPSIDYCCPEGQCISCSGETCTVYTHGYGSTSHSGPIVSLGSSAGTLEPILCDGERFKGQQYARGGSCTAFLVGPDLLMTATHCISPSLCSNRHVVFGFHADASGEIPADPQISADDVYTCEEVLEPAGTAGGTDDWAVFRVDRVVRGRTPLIVRHAGMVPDGSPLVMAGYIKALPLKIMDDAEVTTNDPGDTRFFSSLDTLNAASGGPVVHATTGVVEGIHVTGPVSREEQYYLSGGEHCARELTCSEATGCAPSVDSPWMGHTRVTIPADHIPLHSALLAAAVM